LNDSSVKIAEELSKNPHCSTEVLIALSRHEKAHIRAETANHKSISEAVLRTLGTDSSSWVRDRANYRLAKQTRELETQRDLMRTNDPYVLRYLSTNPNSNPSILAAIADSDEEELRMNVSKNQNCSVETLKKLANDPLSRIRISAEEKLAKG
jgi:hypothetical protein